VPTTDVFNLSLAAAIPPEPDHLASEDFNDGHEGPDLSWMQPKQRRAMVFSESEHSALRARLVQLEVPADEDFAGPSLWARLRDWWGRTFG
jgi:hypothetical protein